MNRQDKQKGVVLIELVIVVVFLAVVGFIGYKVMITRQSVNDVNKSIDATELSTKSTSLTTVPTAPTINSSKDLDSADKVVDQVNPDDNDQDETQLDRQLEF